MNRFLSPIASWLLLWSAAVELSSAAESLAVRIPQLGIEADSFSSDTSVIGVRVVRIEPNAPVTDLRLLPHDFFGGRHFLQPYRDIIIAVEGKTIRSVKELETALRRAPEECRLTLYNRSKQQETVYFVRLR